MKRKTKVILIISTMILISILLMVLSVVVQGEPEIKKTSCYDQKGSKIDGLRCEQKVYKNEVLSMSLAISGMLFFIICSMCLVAVIFEREEKEE